MIAFEINDMTCGHCVSTITKAVKQADRNAVVTVDLDTKRVQIEPTEADEAELKAVIEEAGYTPVVATTPVAPSAFKAAGSCCGDCH